MTAVYTTSAKVWEYLQRTDGSSDFTSGTVPTDTTVDTFIEWAQGEIEQVTGQSWQAVTNTDEYHTMRFRHDRINLGSFPYVQLHKSPIYTTFTSGTDKIEVWNGSSWVDWALTANSKSEARDGDYWVDYENGKIYFVKGFPIYATREVFKNVRVTYRSGYSTVDDWVERLATQIAAIHVLEFDRTQVIASGGGGDNIDKPTMDAQIASLKEETRRKLDEARPIVKKQQYNIL
jgi:hypothetical protein